MKNYFEHEIQSKYVEGILNKNIEWNWIIEYIENEFDGEFNVDSFQKFRTSYGKIHEVLMHLIKINEITTDLAISKEWLKDIDMLSKYYLNKLEFNELHINNNFVRLCVTFMYCAKIINEKSTQKYIIYTQLFEEYNIYEIIDVDDFDDDNLIKLINEMPFDFSKEKEIYEENIKKSFHKCEKINQRILELCDDFNSFSFRNTIELTDNSTWEEQYLCEMLQVDYDGKNLYMFGSRETVRSFLILINIHQLF